MVRSSVLKLYSVQCTVGNWSIPIGGQSLIFSIQLFLTIIAHSFVIFMIEGLHKHGQ